MSEKCRTCEKLIRADQYRETTDGVKAECEEKHVTTHPGVTYPVAERDHILSKDCWCEPTVEKP